MASIVTGYEESTRTTGRMFSRALALFNLPRVLILLAAILLGLSVVFEYWSLTLHAPQYPDGLEVTIFTHEVVGDVSEVDGLNHYIGMMPLAEAAELERDIASAATIIIVALGIAAAILRPRLSALLAVPIALFPIVFAADLYFWLYKAGHDLDPTAALSSSIKPFTPAILGEGIVGQFSTTAHFGAGFWIAVAAAVLAIVGIVSRMRGERPQVSR
jgi:copper chaperone NosL